jgi:hypothetical protein
MIDVQARFLITTAAKLDGEAVASVQGAGVDAGLGAGRSPLAAPASLPGIITTTAGRQYRDSKTG